MQIKQKPEDFFVREVLEDNTIKEKGDYHVYILKKEKIETVKCLLTLTTRFNIRFKDIGYCGLKDKHSLTEQYITLPEKIDHYETERFSIKHVGYSDHQLQRGENKGNEFIIKAKLDDDEIKRIKHNIPHADKFGVLNYYGKQRIGRKPINMTFAFYFLKKDYKEALVRYYIHLLNYSNSSEKEAIRAALKVWGDWRWVLDIMNTQIRDRSKLEPLKEMVKNNDYEKALMMIKPFTLELLINGLQSALWNEIITAYVEKNKGNVGDREVDIPYSKVKYGDELDDIFEDVLEKYGLERKDLDVPKGFKVKMNTGSRNIFVYPKNLKFDKGRSEFSFFLPSGSFATVLLDALVA